MNETSFIFLLQNKKDMAAFQPCPEVVAALHAAFERRYYNVLPAGAEVTTYGFQIDTATIPNVLERQAAMNSIVRNFVATVESVENGFIVLGAPNPTPFSCRTYEHNGGTTTCMVAVRLVRKRCASL